MIILRVTNHENMRQIIEILRTQKDLWSQIFFSLFNIWIHQKHSKETRLSTTKSLTIDAFSKPRQRHFRSQNPTIKFGRRSRGPRNIQGICGTYIWWKIHSRASRSSLSFWTFRSPWTVHICYFTSIRVTWACFASLTEAEVQSTDIKSALHTKLFFDETFSIPSSLENTPVKASVLVIKAISNDGLPVERKEVREFMSLSEPVRSHLIYKCSSPNDCTGNKLECIIDSEGPSVIQRPTEDSLDYLPHHSTTSSDFKIDFVHPCREYTELFDLLHGTNQNRSTQSPQRGTFSTRKSDPQLLQVCQGIDREQKSWNYCNLYRVL